VADARHVLLHWDDEEAREQMAFADVLLLNKIDLVTEPELEALEQRICGVNPLARGVRTSVVVICSTASGVYLSRRALAWCAETDPAGRTFV
jgi:G3E family GTPase